MERKKTRPAWQAPVWGAALAAVVYLGTMALAALILVRGALPQDRAVLLAGACCALAAAAGGMTAVRRGSWPPLWAALAAAGLFALVLTAAGSVWTALQGESWSWAGLAPVPWALAGGIAGALTGRRRRSRRRSGRIGR